MAGITWDRDAAAHLLRRAGLPGPPGEVDALEALGLEGAVDRLLEFEQVDNSAMFVHLVGLELDLNTPQGILRDWLVRFLHSARPFEERMALFWHMHFATGLGKVKIPFFMYNQVQTFRMFGRTRFDELLTRVSQDPAMLIWLDNIHNHKNAPNENYARELMELYSMGLNTYTQDDVVAAARALTGWTLLQRRGSVEFVFDTSDHDYGEKTFLGETGAWDGDDIIRIIAEQEVTPRFMASKMWSHFAGGDAPEAVIDDVAAAYWSSDHSLLEMFRALFTHDAFYAPEQRRARIKGPVEYTCGLLRQLGGSTDGSGIPGFLEGQGQSLYNAADPSGWDEGMAWVTTASLLLRSQLASVVGLARNRQVDVDPVELVRAAGVSTPEGAVDDLTSRLGLPELQPDRRTQLAAYLTTNPYTGLELPFDLESEGTAFKLAGLIHVLATDPAYAVA